jgi:hypothetical protein
MTATPSFCLLLALCALPAAGQQASPPDPHTLLRQVQGQQRKLDKTRENYTYTESIVTRQLDKGGAVKKTETEEDNVFFVNGHEVRRQISKDGEGLSAIEQRKEQDRVMKAIDKAQNTPSGQSTNNNTVSITQILALMQLSNPRRDSFDGRSTLAFDFTGDPHSKTHGVAENASKKISGTIWIDEHDREVRRLVARFDDNFHLGFGLFSVGKGSNFVFNQKIVNNELWLPVDAQAHVIAHAFGLIGFRADVSVTDTSYQRFHATAAQVPSATKVSPPK